MKRFLIAFLAALVVVGAIVAIGMSLRPGDQSTDVLGWFDEVRDHEDRDRDISFGSRDLVAVDLQDTLDWTGETEISIDSDVSDLDLVWSDSDQIQVHTTGKVSEGIEVDVSLEKKQDRIVIRISQDRPESLFNNTTNLDTTITLPKAFQDELKIKTNVGDVNFGAFTGKTLTIDSDVGDVMGTGQADFIEIESNVGEIDVLVDGGQITLISDVGEIEFTCQSADELMAQSDVGAIHATLSQDLIEKGIAADAGVGEVDASISFTEGKDRNAVVQIYTDVGEIELRTQ
jgi:DUF4097 and DUF4098 domain-containing protein YvlB